MKSNSHCFKVGDIVRCTLSAPTSRGEMIPNNQYVVTAVDSKGRLTFNSVTSVGWYPENFELCKNQVVINILNDL